MGIASQAERTSAFQLKGTLFPTTRIELYSTDLTLIAAQLTALQEKAPNFFNQTPVIIDFSAITNPSLDIDPTELIELLQRHHIIPIGLTCQPHHYDTVAGWQCLPVLPAFKSTRPKPPRDAAPSTAALQSSLIVSRRVRSGQQIYAKQKDLVVTGSVSTGAELIADGNIHVYGTLRGRALAGAQGNTEARIFCQAFAGELVSIAGIYRLQEDISQSMYGQPIQAYLTEDKLQLDRL